MTCIGSSRVSMRISWYRNGVLVGATPGKGGISSVSDAAGTRCIRGGVYQPWVTVTATAPNAVPLYRNIPGVPGRYCG
jgi:hypothetical protein